MSRPSRHRVLAALLAAGLASASFAAEVGDLPAIPEPNLEQMEPAVKEQLSEVRAAFDALAAQPSPPREAVVAAAGRLGQLYLLYNLADPAAAALRYAQALAPEDFRWPYYLGVIEQERGRLDEAAESFDRALALRPGDPPTLIRVGQVALARNLQQEAEAAFQRALAAAEAMAPAARFGLGQLALLRGEHQRAAGEFEAVLAAQPEATTVHYPLGQAYRELGDLERARAHLGRRGTDRVWFPDPLIEGLVELVAGAGIYIVRGNRFFAEGRYDLAAEAYGRAVAGDPENVTALQAYAASLARLGKVDDAIGQYREILRRTPDDATMHYNLATLLVGKGQTAEAVEHFRRAVEITPEFIDGRFNLALTLDAVGRPEEAVAQYTAILELAPEDTPARLQRARLLARLGRHGEAETDVLSVLEREPENAAAIIAHGAVLAVLGRTAEALERYRAVLALDAPGAEAAQAHFLIGNIHASRGAFAEAIPHFRGAAELAPDLAQVWVNLANALGRARRYAEAGEAFDRALALDRRDQGSHFGRAMSLLLAGRDAEAAAGLEQATRAFPENLALKHALARLLAASLDPEVRDGERSLTLAEEAFAAEPRVEFAETVAMAYAELGRFDEATGLQRRIIEQARAAGRSELLPGLEARLTLYEQRRPVRAPWAEGPDATGALGAPGASPDPLPAGLPGHGLDHEEAATMTAKPARLSEGEKLQEIEALYERSARKFPGVASISVPELLALQREREVVLIDVRTAAEQRVSMLPGAITREAFDGEPERYQGRALVTYCTVGARSGRYAAELSGRGFEVLNLRGSILAWTHAGGELIDGGAPTRRVHVAGPRWNFAAAGYEPVW